MGIENGERKKVAVIAGASGLVGKELLPQLLQSSNYEQVIALVRRPLELNHPNLLQITVNFSELPHLPEFSGADIYCTIGTTLKRAGSREAFRAIDYDVTLALAKTAIDGGALQFLLVSSIGANVQSTAFYLRVKGELEEALKLLSFRSLQIFQPGFLVDHREETRTAERFGGVLAKALDFAFVGKLKKYSAIDVTDLASAMRCVAHGAKPGVHIYAYEQILTLAKS